MPEYLITIHITSDQSEYELDKDAQAAAEFLQDRGIHVDAWDLEPADEENESDDA